MGPDGDPLYTRGFVVWVSEPVPDCPIQNCPRWTEWYAREIVWQASPAYSPNGLRTFCNACKTMVITQP